MSTAPFQSIPVPYYRAENIFTQEMESIFRADWQFACLTDELARHGDFVCVDLPGEAVVLQNFRGEIRAFKNVCTHRFSRIQTAERGNRQLICPYHGWSFDQDGAPAGTRATRGFKADGEGRAGLCLRRYKVEACGKFVFFALNDDQQSLSSFLGPFFRLLTEISGFFGNEISYGVASHKANWKLLVENVLECYHCSIVHATTLSAGLGVGRTPIADVQTYGGHSSSHFPRTEIKREALRKRAMAHLNDRPFTHFSFFHMHIFPNLFIASTEGTSFYVGHALPVSAKETSLRMRFLAPQVSLPPRSIILQEMLNGQADVLGRKIIEEDRAILENVQRGAEAASQPATLGEEEVRIKAFMTHYLATLANGRPQSADAFVEGNFSLLPGAA